MGRVLALWLLCGCNAVFGITEIQPTTSPDAPPPPASWSMVAGGVRYTCALESDGTLWCWGRNESGELGGLGASESDSPQQVGTDTWIALSAADYHACGIKTDHTLWCW